MKLLLCLQLVTSSLLATTYSNLVEKGLINESNPPKIHLGCGEKYLNDYINIDLPSDSHTIQDHIVADYLCNITKMTFPKGSISELRNHHLFEHFQRSTALALLTAWHSWLKLDGILHIETPDLKGCITKLSSDIPYKEKQKVIRHLFGSQEAYWAIHYDGWYLNKFERVLEAIGFELVTHQVDEYKNLLNITIIARKKEDLSIVELKEVCKEILSDSLVDQSTSESKLLEYWYESYLNSLVDLGME